MTTLVPNTPEDAIRERLTARGRTYAAGYTQVAIQVVEGHESAIEDWARVFRLGDRPRQHVAG